MAFIGDFLSSSSSVSIFVLAWLCFYFFITLWVFFYRFVCINKSIKIERESLVLLASHKIKSPTSISIVSDLLPSDIGKNTLHIWKNMVLQNASKGLVVLAIIASTAPFIGLFGTVIEILEAFRYLGNDGKVSFDIIAPVISKALVATAAGILTAIPAYSFHLFLKRKLYDLGICLQMELDVLSSKSIDATNKIRI